MHYILSIDVGSSSSKIALFDTQGHMVTLVRKSSKVLAGEGTNALREYDPSIWWNSLVDGIQELILTSKINPSKIIGIGLAGQIGTHLIVDKAMCPLLDAISWQDGRASDQAKWLKEHYNENQLREALGMHLPPGTAWPIPRLLWLKEHHPELFNSSSMMIQVKDYIAYKLTGTLYTDVLSLRGLVHPSTRSIDPLITDTILHIPNLSDHIPAYGTAEDLLGRVTEEVAQATSLVAGTPVFTGCGDFHASLVGTGIVDDTMAFNITGTSDHIGWLCHSHDRQIHDSRIGRYPSIIDGWDIWYGATSAGGGSFQWFLDTLGDKAENESIRVYVERALADTQDPSTMLYLPYLNGERAPIWNVHARSAFVGFGASHTRSHFLKSVLEGVCFSLRDNFSLMQAIQHSPTQLRVSGAAGGDRAWNQLKADILGIEVISMECQESSSLGAAIIAARGLGVFSSYQDAVVAMVRPSEHFFPDPERKSYYDRLFPLYRKLYDALSGIYEDLAVLRGSK